MKLAYAIELVLAIAVGLACVRAAHDSPPADLAVFGAGMGDTIDPPEDPIGSALNLFGAYFLPAFAVVGTFGVCVEALRKKSPRSWGMGRWAWAFVGLFVLAMSCKSLATLIPYARRAGTMDQLKDDLMREWEDYSYLTGFALLALWVVLRLARLPRDPRPDAREWAGRAFGVLIVAQSVVRIAWEYWR